MSTSPTVARLRQARQQIEAMPVQSGIGELLQVPFTEWCKTLRIKTDQGLKPFELFDWQGDFVDVVLDNPRTPITLLSSRQTGKTADLLAFMVWLSLSREQFTGLLIHRKGDDARQLARRAKKFVPYGTKLGTESLSLIEFLDTGSSLHFRSANHKQEDGAEGTGRGLDSVDVVIIEEASHTRNVKEILGVVGPCMTHSAMATIIFVGTSGARESYFYQSLVDAFLGKEALEGMLSSIRNWTAKPFQVQRGNDRIAVVTNWRAIPKFADEGRDATGYPNYLRRIKKEQDLSDAQISSEHELIFDSDTTSSVFDFAIVKQAEGGEWESRSYGCQYFAGVDGSGKPRPGRKGDYTVCIVLEKEGEFFKVVQLYRKRGITFERRYAEISDMLNAYRPEKTLVEANDGMGQSYLEALSIGCPGIEIDRFINNQQRKALAVNKIEVALERGVLSIPKSPIIDELLSFQQDEDGKMQAVGKNAHDDTVMALGMALVASGFDPVRKFPLIPRG